MACILFQLAHWKSSRIFGRKSEYTLSGPKKCGFLLRQIPENKKKINAIPTKNDYHCSITEEEP
jgi:hypothetical protein